MFYVREVRINKSGYDRYGQYWGIGQKLFEWNYAGDKPLDYPSQETGHFRANDREDAKVRIRLHFKSLFVDHIVFAK